MPSERRMPGWSRPGRAPRTTDVAISARSSRGRTVTGSAALARDRLRATFLSASLKRTRVVAVARADASARACCCRLADREVGAARAERRRPRASVLRAVDHAGRRSLLQQALEPIRASQNAAPIERKADQRARADPTSKQQHRDQDGQQQRAASEARDARAARSSDAGGSAVGRIAVRDFSAVGRPGGTTFGGAGTHLAAVDAVDEVVGVRVASKPTARARPAARTQRLAHRLGHQRRRDRALLNAVVDGEPLGDDAPLHRRASISVALRLLASAVGSRCASCQTLLAS